MAQPLSFRWDEAFIARIDEARGLVSRSAFVRAAVERALGDDGRRVYGRSTPGLNVEHVRSSSQAKRNIKPIPKGK